MSELGAEGGRSALIITSRAPEEWLGDIRREQLHELTPWEAEKFADDLLANCVKAQAQRKVRAFGELMIWLHGHPLSLQLILPQLERTEAQALLDGLRGIGAPPDGFDETGSRISSLATCVKYSLDHLAENVRRLLPALSIVGGVADPYLLQLFSKAPGVPQRFRGIKANWREILESLARVGLAKGPSLSTKEKHVITNIPGCVYYLHPAIPAFLLVEWRKAAGVHFKLSDTRSKALFSPCTKIWALFCMTVSYAVMQNLLLGWLNWSGARFCTFSTSR